MHHSGYSLHDLAQVSKHKNIESLKLYLEQPTIEDMQKYSNSLFDYAEQKEDNKENDQSDDNDFEDPPRPTRNVYKDIQTHRSPTKNTNQNALVPVQNELEESTNSTTSNVMQMYGQNPIGMFVGANLNNCTINITMPK